MEKILKSLDEMFTQYLYKSMPRLKKSTRMVIANLLPWFVLVMSLVAVPGMFAALGIGAIASPFILFGGRSVSMFWLSWVVASVQLVLEVMSIPGLFNRRKAAWMLLYYSNLLGLGMSIISFNLIGILLTLVLIYLLYQIRAEYKK